MAGNRFADWLYDDVDGDEEAWGDCHLAPVPIRFGRRVMYCFPDHHHVVRFPHVELAKLAFQEAVCMLRAAEALARYPLEELANAG